MDAKNLTVTEVVRNFSEYINRIVYRQESFILSKGKKPVAELRPVPTGRRLGDLPSILRSTPHLSEGDAETFANDIESAREALASGELRDPWAS